jgi:hypothetical protein
LSSFPIRRSLASQKSSGRKYLPTVFMLPIAGKKLQCASQLGQLQQLAIAELAQSPSISQVG